MIKITIVLVNGAFPVMGFSAQLWWGYNFPWLFHLPPHLGMGPLHITFPSISIHVIVSVPWVLINPSSQITEIELPNWKLSPNRRALIGIPGSGHSLCPNAWEEQTNKNTQTGSMRWTLMYLHWEKLILRKVMLISRTAFIYLKKKIGGSPLTLPVCLWCK